MKLLVAQKQHLVLQQQRTNLGEQRIVVHGVGQVDPVQLGANGTGHRLDAHRARKAAQRRSRLDGSAPVVVLHLCLLGLRGMPKQPRMFVSYGTCE